MTRVSWSLTSLFSTNMAISETTNDKKPIYCAFRADWQPFWILQLTATRLVCQLVADQFLKSHNLPSYHTKFQKNAPRNWGVIRGESLGVTKCMIAPFLQRAQCSHCKRCISYSNSVCLSVRLSACLSVRLSGTRRYCVKTAARSKVQFAHWIAKCV